jgi:hypothetical protein
VRDDDPILLKKISIDEVQNRVEQHGNRPVIRLNLCFFFCPIYRRVPKALPLYF